MVTGVGGGERRGLGHGWGPRDGPSMGQAPSGGPAPPSSSCRATAGTLRPLTIVELGAVVVGGGRLLLRQVGEVPADGQGEHQRGADPEGT